MSFNVGDEVPVSVEVRDNGVDVNDPGLVLEVVAPSGITTTYVVGDLTHDSTGHYSTVLVADAVGVWRWSWVPTGGFSGAATGLFIVGSAALFQHDPWCTPDEALNTPALRSLRDATANPLTAEDPVLRQACVAATEFLYSRTHRRFSGLREVELRPCCAHSYRSGRWPRVQQWPMMDGDSDPIRDGIAECGCTYMTTIPLPVDVQAVEYVMLDGELFTDWRLDGRLLVRTDDVNWPYCSDVIAPDTEVGTFAVHVVVGNEVPTIARLAARELAAELYLADADPSSCRIPTRISTVQRQGATYTRVDTTTLGKDGMLGLRVTDIFLSEFGRRRRRIEMASPDVPSRPRRVGAGPV